MFRRSRAREVALQLLFQRDLNPAMGRAEIEQFVNGRLRDPALRSEVFRLIDLVTTRGEEIDGLLTVASDNWRVTRMAAVDRNVMRIAAAELLAKEESTPPAVAIDEAVELAKRFGTLESPAFVNGVLDKLRQSLETPVT